MKCRTTLAAGLLLTLGACQENPVQWVCPSVPNPAVAVFVVDAVGGGSLVAQATGWYSAGSRQDSLRHRVTSEGDHLAAFGEAGAYDITVEVDGHTPWLRRGVEVPQGICGPGTVRLQASLTPLN